MLAEDQKQLDIPRAKPDLGYIIECASDPVTFKIGRTADVRTRITGMRTHNPFALKLIAVVTGGIEMERELKADMDEHKARGEWYFKNGILDDFIIRARASGRLVKQVPVDGAFAQEHIMPLVTAWLETKPKGFLNNCAGDLGYRFLQGALPDIIPRRDELARYFKSCVPINLWFGYVPLHDGEVIDFTLRSRRRAKATGASA